MKRLRRTVALGATALSLAGCGEVTNTITPAAGTANVITVALDAPPNFSHVGMFEAQALGLFAQTDLVVRFIHPADPLAAIRDGRAEVAVASEPEVLLTRNAHIAVAAVGAILQGPQQVRIHCSTPKATKPRAARSHPPLRAQRCATRTVARPQTRYASAPTYNGLNFVVTENEIVNHAPVIRRFVQAVARGYAAAVAHPEAATQNLVKLNPGLDYTLELAGVRSSLSNFFPTTGSHHPWGWQAVAEWNAFGSYLLEHRIITNPNATPAADTNELLAGQGV